MIIEMVVFDKQINLLGDISEYVDLETERNYDKVSKMVLRVKRNPEMVQLLDYDNIIAYTSEPDYGYTIQHVAYLVEDGVQIIEIYAYSLNWFASKATLITQNRFYGNIENVVKNGIYYNLINPTNPNRAMPNLILGANQGINITVSSSQTGGDLLENSFEILNPYECTFDILMNHQTKKFELYTWRGADRSIDQSVNPHVIFSQEFDNILQQKYFKSKLDFKNVAVVAGEGEGIDRTIVIVNDHIQGYARRELYVDARDLQRTYTDENGDPVTLTEAQYTAELTNRGIEKLAQNNAIETFESTIEDVQFQLGKDYFLGDRVTFQDKEINVLLNVRVTSILTTADKNGIKRQPSFGTGLPNK